MGRTSIRYMRMKPRIRESPTQACGVRWEVWVGSSEEMEGVVVAESPRIPISPGVVGVFGGVVSSEEVRSSPAGITGPGSASKGSLGGELLDDGHA